uniref:Uncharacterized protein n=1 Tax=viral metagenome TaxID=1070528 RepID=A0A6C0LR13_9ZZZZ
MRSQWELFADSLKQYFKCCSINYSNDDYSTIKVCNIKSIKHFYAKYREKYNLKDTIFLDPDIEFISTFIASKKMEVIFKKTYVEIKNVNDYYLEKFNLKQIMDGYSIIKNGNPFMNFSDMKRISINNNEIDGHMTIINYDNLKLKIGNKEIAFTDFSKYGIIFINYDLFTYSNKLTMIIAKDKNNNIILLQHPRIDIFNLIQLLLVWDVINANILNCNNF